LKRKMEKMARNMGRETDIALNRYRGGKQTGHI
jgi:hypothetical protein